MSSPKSVKKRHRRINIVRAIKALSSAAMVAAPVDVITGAAWAGRTTTGISQVPLNQVDSKLAVGIYYNLTALNNDPAWNIASLTDYLTNMPGFYSDTPTLYRFIPCNASETANGAANFFTVVNLAGAELFSDPNYDWVQPGNNFTFYGAGVVSFSPGRSYVPPGFVVHNQAPIELCTKTTGTPSFLYPPQTNATNSNLVVGAISHGNLTINPTDDDSSSEFTPFSSGGYVFRSGINTASFSQALTVPVQFGGDAVYGVDYVASYSDVNGNRAVIPAQGGSIVIPANEGLTFIYIDWYTKTQNQPEKLLTITTTPPAGYGQWTVNNIVLRALPVDIPNITFSPTSSTTLNGGQTGQFTVTRTGGNMNAPLVVNYTTGGSATNGSDYGYLDGSLEIPAGQSTATAYFPILNRGGSEPIPEEQIVITPVDPGAAYNLPSAAPLTYTLPAYSPSQISVTPGNSGVARRGETTSFTIGRDPSGDLSQPLAVNYSLGGAATPGQDYTSSVPGTSGTVTIPAGQSTATVPITVPDEQGSTAKPAEDVVLTVVPGNGYALQDPAPTSTMMIPAYDPAAVMVTPIPNGFEVTRPATDTGKPLTFNYTLGGTATPGQDYTVPGGTTGAITIPAGQTTAALPVDVKPNTTGQEEPEETITITPAPGNGYSSDAVQPATITIPATTHTPLTGGTATNPPAFTVSRPAESDLSQPVTVPYEVIGGTATPSEDFGLPATGTITIPAGETTGSVPLGLTPGVTAGETITARLTPPAGHKFATPEVTYTVAPNDIPAEPTTPLTSGTSTNPPSITVSRPVGSDLTQPVEVPYQVTGGTATPGSDFGLPGSGTITIPAGQQTGSAPLGITPTATPGETVGVTLTPPEGYTLDNPNVTYTIGQGDIPAQNSIPLTVAPGDGGFTVTRPTGSDLSQPVTIPYDVSNGDGNIRPLPDSVTIPAGQTSAQIPISPLPGANPGETVTLNLKPPAGYSINDPTVDYTVPQGDMPQVGLGNDANNGMGNGNSNGGNGGNGNGNGNGSNGGSIPGNPNASVQDGNLDFTVVRTPGSDPNRPLEITYDIGGTAIPGEDYAALPGKVTIPGGKNKVRVPIRLLKDPFELQGKTIRIRLLDGTTYDLMPGRAQGDIDFNQALIDALKGRGSGANNGNGNGNTGDGNGNTGNNGDGVDVTIDDNGDDEDNDGGSGGGSAGVIAPVAGLGLVGVGTAAATGVFGGAGGALTANSCPVDFDLPAQVEQLAKQVDREGSIDWSQISFSKLPQVNGQPAAMAFTLGQFGSTLGDLSLSEIASITGMNMNSMTLSSLLSLNPSAKVSDIPGLEAYLTGASNKQVAATGAAINGETMLSSVLSQRPAARSVTLGSIEGALEMELKMIANWEQIQIGQVPGLAEAPFSELFLCLGQESEIIPIYEGPANGNPVPPPVERQPK